MTLSANFGDMININWESTKVTHKPKSSILEGIQLVFNPKVWEENEIKTTLVVLR
jgi:hypothetical protein